MASSWDVSTGSCPNPGDTGTGKTSVVQHVGRLLGREAPINQGGQMWPCDMLKLSRVPSCRGFGVQFQRAE